MALRQRRTCDSCGAPERTKFSVLHDAHFCDDCWQRNVRIIDMREAAKARTDRPILNDADRE